MLAYSDRNRETITKPPDNSGDSKDSDDSLIEFDTSQEEQKNVDGFKNRLALILLTLNPKHEIFYPDEDPLESGLLFAVLLRKLSQMLENSRIDNLILTEIWLQIATLPLEKSKPETFYLYAF